MPTDTPENEPLLVSTAKAAEMLGVSPWTVHQLRKSGELQSGLQGNKRLFSVASIRAYADRLVGGAA